MNKHLAERLLHKLKTKSLLNQNHVFENPIAIISTYNECDIIKDIILESLTQFDVYVVDNWSTDGTWEIVQEIASDRIIGKEQFPKAGPNQYFELKSILVRIEEIAKQFPRRWILHQDSDEITIMPFENINACNVFQSVLDMGYNGIALRILDFSPIDDGFTCGNPRNYFNYYKHNNNRTFAHHIQFKIWYQPDNEQVDLASKAGHRVMFSNAKIFPIKFPRLHYSIRSTAHKIKKEQNRTIRIEKELKESNWHSHLKILFETECIKHPDSLIKYEFDQLYNDCSEWLVKQKKER